MSTVTVEQLAGWTKCCPRCGEHKPDSGFYSFKGRGGRNGLSSWCRTCMAAQAAVARKRRVADEIASGQTSRRCRRCKEEKVFAEFTSMSWHCRPCAMAYAKERRARNPDGYRKDRLWSRFRITEKDYDRMLLAQDGVCAVCARPPKRVRLHVDHDHACCPERGRSCGKCIRGLVCYPCNTKIALLEVDVAGSIYASRLRAYLGVKVVLA